MSTDGLPGATAAGRYTIRPYEPADLDGFLRLDREVWDRERPPEWVRWKYVANPYTDHTPIFVAEHDGEIVGARPFLGFELRIGEQSVIAYQPADTMVHPDHRRAGVFQRMTDCALSAYRGREPALFFNFPNEHARPGYLDLGWRAVAPEVTYYRVESPGSVGIENEGLQRASRALRPLVSGYYAARQAVSTPPEGYSVRQLDGAATERLAAIHDRCRLGMIHAARTETFLQWRLSSPVWERRTYLINGPDGDRSDRDQPVAALVSRTRTNNDGLRITQVVDVAPLCGGQQWAEAVWRGLEAVLATHPETDLFAVSDGAIPASVLTALGFLPDDSPPVSLVTSFESMLVTRPNADPDDETAWRLGGWAIDDADNWCVTFAERDTT